MQGYKKILLAVELDAACNEKPVKRALGLASKFHADIILLHAIENASDYGTMYGVSVSEDVKKMLHDSAAEKIAALGKKMGVPEKRQIVEFGSANIVILDAAEHVQADLIVVGSHGRNVIRLLLGSTANSVLHEAKCDVLAVRL